MIVHRTPSAGAFVVFALLSATAVGQIETDRQDAVRERGATVMPFSLADTLHVFEKTDQGGLQRVEVRAGHSDQVAMIQQHLKDIAERFAQRDFSAPAQIHGDDMPGLRALQSAAPSELSVVYRATDLGAAVNYIGHTDAIRDAIHRWFDAQRSDHGHDASDHHQHHGG